MIYEQPKVKVSQHFEICMSSHDLRCWLIYEHLRSMSVSTYKYKTHSHMFHIGLYGDNVEKTSLSETTRPRALIFGLSHHLVDLYQVCSNNTRGAKMAQPRGQMFSIGLFMENLKKSSCLKPQGLEP